MVGVQNACCFGQIAPSRSIKLLMLHDSVNTPVESGFTLYVFVMKGCFDGSHVSG